MIEVEIRDGSPEDLSYIFATWLRCYKHYSYFAKRVRYDVFFKWHHKILERIIARPETKILIATPIGDSAIVIGYLIYASYEDGPVIHFVFTKGPFKKLGVARALITHSGLDLKKCSFDHWCFDTNWIVQKHPELTYNPYTI